jgi:hypothetical protein
LLRNLVLIATLLLSIQSDARALVPTGLPDGPDRPAVPLGAPAALEPAPAIERQVIAAIYGPAYAEQAVQLKLRGDDVQATVVLYGAQGEIAYATLVEHGRIDVPVDGTAFAGIPNLAAVRVTDRIGTLIGVHGSAHVWARRTLLEIEIDGETQQLSTLTLMDSDASLERLQQRRRALAVGDGLRTDGDLDGPGLQPGTRWRPGAPTCARCNSSFEADLRFCEVLAESCVAGAAAAAAGALAACVAGTKLPFVFCATTTDLAFNAAVAQCFAQERSCYRAARSDVRQCLMFCDNGSPGFLY